MTSSKLGRRLAAGLAAHWPGAMRAARRTAVVVIAVALATGFTGQPVAMWAAMGVASHGAAGDCGHAMPRHGAPAPHRGTAGSCCCLSCAGACSVDVTVPAPPAGPPAPPPAPVARTPRSTASPARVALRHRQPLPTGPPPALRV